MPPASLPTLAGRLRYENDGAQLLGPAVDSVTLEKMVELLAGQRQRPAGIRLFGVAGMQPLLSNNGPVGALAAAVLGGASRPVRAILFNKTSNAN